MIRKRNNVSGFKTISKDKTSKEDKNNVFELDKKRKSLSGKDKQEVYNYEYMPKRMPDGRILHRAYHYETDERPWAFGPPGWEDEFGNNTNIPQTNEEKFKDMMIDAGEMAVQGFAKGIYLYLKRRVFQWR